MPATVKIHAIFGKGLSDAPEALEVIDNYDVEVNSNYLNAMLEKHRNNPNFHSVEVVAIELDQATLEAVFRPRIAALPGKISAA